MIAVQQATYSKSSCMDFINHRDKEFREFAVLCLRDEHFRKSMTALLPFDRSVSASISFSERGLPIEKIGIVVMRNGFKKSPYSLGVFIEFEGSVCKSTTRATCMLAACRNFSSLERLVKSGKFQAQSRFFFIKQIKDLLRVKE